MSYGSRLASGSKNATFRVSDNISQERWNAIWAEDKEPLTDSDSEQMRADDRTGVLGKDDPSRLR